MYYIEYGYDTNVKAYNVILFDKNKREIYSEYYGTKADVFWQINYWKTQYDIKEVKNIGRY